mgnify:CR=1 FL=1
MAKNTAGKTFLNNLASNPILPMAVIGVAGYFLFKHELSSLFNWLNPFAESKEAKANDAADTTKSCWTPRYYKIVFGNLPQDGKFGVRLQSDTAKVNAQKIYDALGRLSWNHLSDDDTTVIAVFKSMEAKTAVSYLCEVFKNNYDKDLFDWINYYLNTDNMTKVNAIVAALPVGIINSDHKIIK